MEDSYPYNRERGDRDRHGSHRGGEVERAGDEVRSWFGDDEVARRRRMDEQDSNDAPYTEYGRQTYGGPYGRERYGAREWSSTEGWRVPGPHAGRGPRGYQRSDDRIREELNDRLTAHGHIDATDIECRVVNGEVTLTGFVDSRAAKRAAEDIADDLYGVREVHNQLRIRSHGSEGVGRTSVLGLTEAQAETTHPPTASAVDPGRPRTRG
jgi:osmotically-inducible protein OsmY